MIEDSGRREFLATAAVGTTVGVAGCTDALTPDDNGSDSEAADFPSDDIEIICPFDEGGGTDLTARQLSEQLENQLDTSSFVTNSTGGSGSVGFSEIASASADGHTLGILTVEICTVSHLDIGDVTHEDMTPILQYNFDPAALTVHEDAPYDSLEEFVDYAEDNPGEISVSNSGTGAIWHLAAAEFEQAADIELDHIGYEGAAPATEAVLGGEVEATTSSAAEVSSQVQDGDLEMLAFFGDERHPAFEDVPTLTEEGYDVTVGAWRGIGGPAGMDEEIVETLEDAFDEIHSSEEFEEFMENNNFQLEHRDAEEFGQFMDEEYDRFGELIDELGIEGE
ncbi:tripartite tricarboxylate transporter substrate binding protein [Natronococcus sp. A-GB7]|uniref:Bug family tripartite tricarboxylate transporter substrate binding protein n=1 Tax=Natronococcus sp. A-GB7 TaxID=3037649 RepID=UPI00241ECFD3|nr:tripartite tricarboxylate transporter substrate binding protein [Natronococcus sp. A-GB7]MDG5818627.1 tripartite tricarboxylate transporter substrate binding protein [Natronococcus sp. A-GB7]